MARKMILLYLLISGVRNRIKIKSFQSWRNLIISRIRNKIYANLKKNSNTKSLSYNARIKQAIDNLQNELAIVSVDKANNNFAIIS